jgi:2-methylcitrate dehydratase PrpD
MQSATEALVQQALRPVDAATRAHARLHLLDWLACVAGARTSAVAAMARAAEPDVLTRAALLGNLLEMDDVDRAGRLHPGPVLWPAALAAAREVEAPLGALLSGFVRGVEAMVLLGRTLDDRHYAYWHPTATAGQAGAAMAAASLFGLAAPACADALGHAISLAGGLWQLRNEPGVHTKSIHAAQAGLAGLWHARLARAGFAGPRLILEGPQGLWAATTAAPRALATGAPGWRLRELSFKPWPACRHVHAAIDAALLLPPGALDAGPIRVASYGDALVFCDRPVPRDPGEARFSLQHALAVVAMRGRPAPQDFEPDAIADPAIASARARVEVVRDAAFDAAYPAHFGAEVSSGGATVRVEDAWGDPEHPLDEAALVAKFLMLARFGGLPELMMDAAVHAVLEAGEESPATGIVALIETWLPR